MIVESTVTIPAGLTVAGAGTTLIHRAARPLYCFFSLSSSDQLGLEMVPAAGKGDGRRERERRYPSPSSSSSFFSIFFPSLPHSTAAGVLGRNLYPINRLLYARAHNEQPLGQEVRCTGLRLRHRWSDLPISCCSSLFIFNEFLPLYMNSKTNKNYLF